MAQHGADRLERPRLKVTQHLQLPGDQLHAEAGAGDQRDCPLHSARAQPYRGLIAVDATTGWLFVDLPAPATMTDAGTSRPECQPSSP